MSDHTYSVAMTAQVDGQARAHLARQDAQEDLCFALWLPSEGSSRTTAILHQLVLPEPGDRQVHGNASFNPAYLHRALQLAMEHDSGLAFLHSHPAPARGWQGMSPADVAAEESMAAQAKAATGHPLVGLTLAAQDSSWSARFWLKSAPRQWGAHGCESVRVVGSRLRLSYHPGLRPAPSRREELRRTTDAWGEAAQANLARARVAVVGLGSVGSIVCEGLARMGVQSLHLIDPDVLEQVNLDRTLNARQAHVVAGMEKVKVAAASAHMAATAGDFRVKPLAISVCTEQAYRQLLDCDVIFSCVDRPWPRHLLNFVAYAHLIPVIDGGIRIGRTPTGKMRHATWRAHVVTHQHRCLECLGQVDPGQVAMEREGLLDDPTYIESLDTDHPVRSNENVFAFSMGAASLELQKFIQLIVAPGGHPDSGAETYSFPSCTTTLTQDGCDGSCASSSIEATGDRAGDPGLA